MNILLFGAPGAGKGTQSELLKDRKNYFHISTGDLFRSAIKNQTELGMQAKALIDQGKLVPDDVTIGLVDEVLDQINGKNFILDGFPRTVAQAEALDRLLEKKGQNLDKAIFINVPNEALLSRLTGRRVCSSCGAVYHVTGKPTKSEGECDSCGGEVVQRKDDKEDVISTRLNAYETSTIPVLEFYKNKGKYFEVEGLGETEEVFSRINELLS